MYYQPPNISPDTLRQRRQKLRLTQSDLARILGVGTNTIARWERGALRIAHPTMLALAIEGLEARHAEIERQITERYAERTGGR